MGTVRIGMALVLGCLWYAGCAAPDRVGPAAPEDQQVISEAAGAEPESPSRQIEVIETKWPDGTLQSRREVYKDAEGNAIQHGVTTQWWESGQKKSEAHFVDGVQHGEQIVWYDSGEKWSQATFDHGRPVGTLIAWYPNGNKQQEMHYDDDGAKNGMYTLWYENGQKKLEQEFVHGRRRGFETQWDPNGAIVLEINYGSDES